LLYQLLLPNGGRIIVEDSPREVLSKERTQDVFRADVMIADYSARAGVLHVALSPTNGDDTGMV